MWDNNVDKGKFEVKNHSLGDFVRSVLQEYGYSIQGSSMAEKPRSALVTKDQLGLVNSLKEAGGLVSYQALAQSSRRSSREYFGSLLFEKLDRLSCTTPNTIPLSNTSWFPADPAYHDPNRVGVIHTHFDDQSFSPADIANLCMDHVASLSLVISVDGSVHVLFKTEHFENMTVEERLKHAIFFRLIENDILGGARLVYNKIRNAVTPEQERRTNEWVSQSALKKAEKIGIRYVKIPAVE